MGITEVCLILRNIRLKPKRQIKVKLTVTKASPSAAEPITSKVKSIVKPKTVSGLFIAYYLKKRGSFSRKIISSLSAASPSARIAA